MNSLLRLILLIDLLCLSTAGLSIFGLPSPRLRSLKSSSGDDETYEEARIDDNVVEDNAK